MADTIITNSPDRSGGDSAAGWVVALIVLAAVVIGGVYMYRHGSLGGGGSGTNINVTLPSTGGTAGTGGTTK